MSTGKPTLLIRHVVGNAAPGHWRCDERRPVQSQAAASASPSTPGASRSTAPRGWRRVCDARPCGPTGSAAPAPSCKCGVGRYGEVPAARCDVARCGAVRCGAVQWLVGCLAVSGRQCGCGCSVCVRACVRVRVCAHTHHRRRKSAAICTSRAATDQITVRPKRSDSRLVSHSPSSSFASAYLRSDVELR